MRLCCQWPVLLPDRSCSSGGARFPGIIRVYNLCLNRLSTAAGCGCCICFGRVCIHCQTDHAVYSLCKLSRVVHRESAGHQRCVVHELCNRLHGKPKPSHYPSRIACKHHTHIFMMVCKVTGSSLLEHEQQSPCLRLIFTAATTSGNGEEL